MGSTKGLKKRIIGILLTLIMLMQIVFPTLTALAAEGLTDIQFTDGNLYNKVKKELELKSNLTVLYCNDDELLIQVANEDIAKITELNLQGSTNSADDVVKSLTGLEAFTGLQKLHLAQNKLTSDANLGALNGLTNLIELDLSENYIEDVSSISNLTEASKNGNLMLKLTGQTINYIEIINKLPDDEEFNTTSKVRLPQIFDYAYSKGETVTVSGYNVVRYVENGELYLEIGRDKPLRTETKVGNVPQVEIRVNKTADSQEGSTFNTVCNFKYIVIDGNLKEGIIFHEEGNLYYGVKEQIQNTYGIGKNKNGKEYSEIISADNKYFDEEKVMVINKIDLLNDITLLDVSGKGIHYLKGINHFVALQDLILEDNYIQDVTLLKSLIENKTNKSNEVAAILQSKIEGFNTEYNKLVEVFTKYESAMQRKYELEKAMKNETDGEKYAQNARELAQIEAKLVEYKAQKIEFTESTILKLNIVNECLSIDEIIGFNKNIDELKTIIEKLENGGFNAQELAEMKNSLITIYAYVTERVKSLTREELSYLTIDESKLYLLNKINELTEEELREVLGANGYSLRTVSYTIRFPEDAYAFFDVRLDTSNGLKGIKPIVETNYELKESLTEDYYSISYYKTKEEGNIELDLTYKYSKGSKVAKVTYVVPDSIDLDDATVIPYFTGNKADSSVIPETEIPLGTYLERTAREGSSNSADYRTMTKDELIAACKVIINDANSEDELNKFESIIKIVEAKSHLSNNIEYYDDHEIIHDIRADLENMYETELRSFAVTYGINVDDVIDVKQTIIEHLEVSSREYLINILKENMLRERFASVTSYCDKTGSELLAALSINESKLIDLVENEIPISQKYALIDAIMKEVKEYPLGKEENGDYISDDLDLFISDIMESNGLYVQMTKEEEQSDGTVKITRLSDKEVKDNIHRKLVDQGDVTSLKEVLNDLINDTDLATKYITTAIDDSRLYDMTLDFSYPVLDEEGNTKQVTLLDRIAEELNEEIKYISEFGSAATLNAANTLLNYIEPVQSKARYLQTYLNSLNVNNLDENKMASVKTKLDRIAARLDTTNLKELPKLEVLNLAQNEMLINVEPLSSLTTLKILNLANDYMIDDIEKLNVNTFADLEILNLSGIGLKDVNVAGLKKLRCLDLSYNYFENIDNVKIIGDGENPPYHTDNLTNLIHLNLSGNNIYDIQNMVNNLNELKRYQSSSDVGMILPFDLNRDLMLYCQDLSIDLTTTNASNNKIIDLPMIYRQIEDIQGITVSFRGNTNNSGKQVAIPTHKLGNFTEVAEIVGGIGAGTIYTINYTVQDKDEAAKIPVQRITVEEEVVIGNENASMPDLTEDGKVTTADCDKIVEYIGKTEFPKVADVVPDGIINDSDYKLLKEYVKEGWNSDNLTLDQRQKASEADVNGDNTVDSKDLEILALHVLNIQANTATSIADINSDGVINIKDANMLSKYIESKLTKNNTTDCIKLKILNEYKETKQLHATVMPENATDKRVTWLSNNESIVEIDSNGKVKAVKEGTTTITVISVSDTDVLVTIPVIIETAENIVEEINIVEPAEGETGIKTNYYTGEEIDLTGAKIEAKRRDGTKEIVDITAEMLEGFTTETEGEKLVTVTYEGKQTSFTINVTEYTEPKADITIDNLDVKLPENVVYDGQEHLAEVALKEGVKAGKLTVRYEVAGLTVENPDGTMSPIIVEKPVDAGTYKVIAEIAGNIFANPASIEVGTFTIEQAQLPEDQKPNIKPEYTVEKGGSLKLEVENGTLSVPEGITFDEEGPQDITLTFIPDDTNYKAIEIPIKVHVVISVKGVNVSEEGSLDKNVTTITMFRGSTKKFVEKVLPGKAEDGVWKTDATNPNVKWTSSNPDRVEVDAAGNIKAKEVGQATITVTTEDGGLEYTFTVVVKEQIYKMNGQEISNISPDTTKTEFFDKFNNSNKIFRIIKPDGTELTDGPIATGYKMVDDKGELIATLLVKGDVNGDGSADGADASAIIAHYMNTLPITDPAKLKVADMNGDGEIDGMDCTPIIYHFVGISEL